jgi:hypothetical protein
MAPHRITNPKGAEMNTTPQADHVAVLQEMIGWRMPPGKGEQYNAALTAAIEAMQRQGEPVGLPDARHHRIGTRADEPEAWGYVSGWNACRDAMLAAGGASR